ncbi:MAG: ATP-binding protein [Candidatus Poribacteria bacterium]|nr:ATP-binding protein [Candidatus Poribacteria bacterium]
MRLNRLKFQRKLLVIFVGMALLPTVVLVLVSYHLMSRSLERWANHQIALTLADSAEIAQDAGKLAYNLEIYENVPLTEDVQYLAVDEDLVAALATSDDEAIESRANELADAYGEYLIAIYDQAERKIFTTDSDLLPANLTDRDFFPALEELPDLPSTSNGLADQGFLISAMPIFSEDGRERLGAVVVGKSMPLTPTQIRTQMSAIQSKLDVLATNIDEEGTAYRRTEKRTTAIALLITAVLIVAIAFWVSKSFARAMNTPIRSLVAGTKEIADGNLDYRVAVRTDDEFGMLASAFNRMVSDLKARTEELTRAEKIAAWQDIAQKLAHEIKNPLTPIQLSAQRLQRRYHNNSDGFGELLDRCTQTIITEVEGLRQLLDEFSLLAQMPAPQLASVNLRETLDETLDLFGEFPPHIDFHVDFPSDLPRVIVDAAHLKRAFLNLIKNALEAMSEVQKGRLTVHAFASADGSKVFVEFRDTGKGIPVEVRPKLFTPHLSAKKDGMGLGLAIVKKILTDLGGDIRLEEAQPDQTGTTFTLWLKTA